MTPDLGWLLSPITRDRFESDFFEKNIVHLTDRGAGFYDPVFALADLDRMVHQSPDFVAAHVRYGRADEAVRHTHLSAHPKIPTPITPQTLAGSLQAAFAAGYSLIFDDLATAWWPLARFTREIQTAILGPVTAAMFFSPPHSQGVPVHYDGFDVFILQVSGCKDWKVYRPSVVLPIGPQPLGDADIGQPIAELTLRPGDLLYMPRGFVHEARSRDTAAMHLTIGLHPCRWYELLGHLVEGLAEHEVALRRSLPLSVCRAIATGAAAGDSGIREQLDALLRRCADRQPRHAGASPRSQIHRRVEAARP